jgi:hypothetical protein
MDGGAGFLALLLKETKVGCMRSTIKEKRVLVNRKIRDWDAQTVGCAAAHQSPGINSPLNLHKPVGNRLFSPVRRTFAS